MKILYISSLILKKVSSAAIRNTGLITGLIKNKIDVDILTVRYSNELEDKYLNVKLINSNIYKSNLKILSKYLNVKTSIKNTQENILKNLLKIIKNTVKNIYFFPDIDKEWITEFNKLNINFKEYDLIISSSDTKTSHYIGEKIKKLYPNIIWFQIWGDPWSSDIGLSKLKKIRAKFKEKELLKKADRIFYVSPFTLNDLRDMYPEFSNKMKYIPRGYLEEVKGSSKSKRDKIIITYTGVLNKNRNILHFLKLLKEYNEKNLKNIEFNIYGNVDENLLKSINVFSFVYYKGSISFEEIKEVYKKSDYLLFIDNGNNTTQIPGKIYDYLGTDKKIICLFKNKNEIYNYFKNELRLLTYQEDEIDILEILNSPERIIDKRFSNDIIAKKLIEYYMEMKR
ncbi:glycosyltransferase family protein [Fusobacterium sp. THCT1E2]